MQDEVSDTVFECGNDERRAWFYECCRVPACARMTGVVVTGGRVSAENAGGRFAGHTMATHQEKLPQRIQSRVLILQD